MSVLLLSHMTLNSEELGLQEESTVSPTRADFLNSQFLYDGCVVLLLCQVADEPATSVVSGSSRLEELASAITDNNHEHQHGFGTSSSHGCGTGELTQSVNNRC